MNNNKYLEQENTSDLLKFWIQAENFSRNLLNFKKSSHKDSISKSELENLYKQWQNDAMIIYDK